VIIHKTSVSDATLKLPNPSLLHNPESESSKQKGEMVIPGRLFVLEMARIFLSPLNPKAYLLFKEELKCAKMAYGVRYAMTILTKTTGPPDRLLTTVSQL
jgi:hypothetical protein